VSGVPPQADSGFREHKIERTKHRKLVIVIATELEEPKTAIEGLTPET
jgi:hypothetical protein